MCKPVRDFSLFKIMLCERCRIVVTFVKDAQVLYSEDAKHLVPRLKKFRDGSINVVSRAYICDPPNPSTESVCGLIHVIGNISERRVINENATTGKSHFGRTFYAIPFVSRCEQHCKANIAHPCWSCRTRRLSQELKIPAKVAADSFRTQNREDGPHWTRRSSARSVGLESQHPRGAVTERMARPWPEPLVIRKWSIAQIHKLGQIQCDPAPGCMDYWIQNNIGGVGRCLPVKLMSTQDDQRAIAWLTILAWGEAGKLLCAADSPNQRHPVLPPRYSGRRREASPGCHHTWEARR